MPTISGFLGMVIAMYFDDHGPPHFHARHADGEAKVRIDTLEPMDSHGTLRLAFAGGLVGEVDVLERMHGPVFSQARTRAGFERVSIDGETGIWPDQNVAA